MKSQERREKGEEKMKRRRDENIRPLIIIGKA